ncbi:hypothetical protein [Fluviispira multicolorata]|uniref:Uncharacterized protein n=1 Tax=Fluviispira multicolorata TaxID=2654512 RepID=A0A833JFB9_9BACT|nr:hypothetical protein [Fluviispira multicolorata]KAB8033318.1 hypothetical protein GCL57_01065 [Fluviispira multicolorata]
MKLITLVSLMSTSAFAYNLPVDTKWESECIENGKYILNVYSDNAINLSKVKNNCSENTESNLWNDKYFDNKKFSIERVKNSPEVDNFYPTWLLKHDSKTDSFYYVIYNVMDNFKSGIFTFTKLDHDGNSIHEKIKVLRKLSSIEFNKNKTGHNYFFTQTTNYIMRIACLDKRKSYNCKCPFL